MARHRCDVGTAVHVSTSELLSRMHDEVDVLDDEQRVGAGRGRGRQTGICVTLIGMGWGGVGVLPCSPVM